MRCFSQQNKKEEEEEEKKQEEEQESETEYETDTEDEEEGEEVGADGVPVIKDCLYETLGVSKEANKEDIRAAYLSKAREFHPDKRPDCLAFFTHCTKAYETLYDEHRRAVYDDDCIPDEEYFIL